MTAWCVVLVHHVQNIVVEDSFKVLQSKELF